MASSLLVKLAYKITVILVVVAVLAAGSGILFPGLYHDSAGYCPQFYFGSVMRGDILSVIMLTKGVTYGFVLIASTILMLANTKGEWEILYSSIICLSF